MGKLTFESGDHLRTDIFLTGVGSAPGEFDLEPVIELDENYEYMVQTNIFVTFIGTTGSIGFGTLSNNPFLISRSGGSWRMSSQSEPGPPEIQFRIPTIAEFPAQSGYEILALINVSGATAGELTLQIKSDSSYGSYNVSGHVDMIRNLKTS